MFEPEKCSTPRPREPLFQSSQTRKGICQLGFNRKASDQSSDNGPKLFNDIQAAKNVLGHGRSQAAIEPCVCSTSEKYKVATDTTLCSERVVSEHNKAPHIDVRLQIKHAD